MYEIIEDHSPFCISFKFPGLEELISYIKTLKPVIENGAVNYYSRTFDVNTANSILTKLPMYKDLDWLDKRVSVFTTPPGKCSSIHKDGSAYKEGATTWDKIGLNIPLTVLDDKCITRWYADETFKDNNLHGWPFSVKALIDPDGYNHIPNIKELVMRPNEMVLINLDYFHSWENNTSKNIRELLTLRVKHGDTITFFDVRKKLFGY